MKKILLIVLAFFAFAEGFAQTQLWSKTTEGKLNILEKTERTSFPSEYQLYHLNFSALKSQLAATPSRSSKQASDVVISFPNAEGKLERYRIYEASVLEAPLAAEQKGKIQSYVGKGIDNPTATIRFSTTIFGLHNMTFSEKGTSYIDPYTKDLENYIVYDKSSLTNTKNFSCNFHDDDHAEEGVENRLLATDGIFRTYRLAMACTVEYAAFHIQRAGIPATASLEVKKDAVLAAMAVTMTRVNGIYEKDMSLTMVLVSNNKNAIFVDSDTLTNTPAVLINEIQPVMDAAIGFDNYDIGHASCTDDNGIAQLNSPCSANKARGVTGQVSPVGDPFDIDYVAHEMGHQFGATHTQNNDCNRTASTAVEPGSASTIMGYAGICAPNVQTNSDDYFHAVSLNQMFNFVRAGGNCSVNTPNGNTAPEIDVLPTSYTIPAGTPFVLRGGATDVDNDVLTYCWEQYNPGTNTLVATPTTTTSGPNFRSFSPTTSPNRYFPSLATLASGVSSTWEVIPTVARTMNFALTIRDNRTPNGGQTARRNVGVVFDASGTPFTVTSQSGASGRNSNETAATEGWLAGETKTITWNVGTTNVAPISVANVNILLSTDGGQTFTMLLQNTPNDGSQDITVPNVAPSLNCRIMVEAVGNSFFAINRSAFAIGYIITTNCESYTIDTAYAIPDNAGFVIKTINVPTAGVISDVNLTANISHTKLNDLNIALLSPANTQINLFNRGCASTATTATLNATFDDQGTAIVCGTNVTGNIQPLQALSTFNGQSRLGNWIIGIRDLAAGNTGTVNSITLNVCSQTAVLSTKSFGLADFKIYPNPNNGNFSVQFNSNSGKEIKVNVHDISGRQILSKSFQNNGMFSENIQMTNIQKGIYIVTVLDGDVKETKKIVVQ